MAVQFYSSEDAGAPQWSTSVSAGTNNIIDILDAILITGYGDKPGFGWTKEMTSSVTDRTVYSNQSAHANKMNLMVQSHPSNSSSTLWQIADSVITPEEYYGYSSVISLGFQYGFDRWIAIGDERTMIFSFLNSSMKTSHFYIYAPNILYVGDVDTHGVEMPNGWVLLGYHSTLGVMDNVTNTGLSYGIFNSMYHQPQTASRPFTTLPTEEWAEENMTFHCIAFNMSEGATAYWPSKVSGYTDLDEFLNSTIMRAPWYMYVNSQWLFRLRGCHSFTPELFYFDKANGQTRGFVPFMLDGTEFVPSHTWNGMFFQVSGDW
ncbi:hypothetical protein [Endozoicomonas ascidiicola]|uniref:hypothetical protein n=1 Tax=Endozoicomonas ascidiicola TaxID=1698521 RepID=UPI00082D79BD|nr:hypothetical protein [Endozoicomonas ascidiicola]